MWLKQGHISVTGGITHFCRGHRVVDGGGQFQFRLRQHPPIAAIQQRPSLRGWIGWGLQAEETPLAAQGGGGGGGKGTGVVVVACGHKWIQRWIHTMKTYIEYIF